MARLEAMGDEPWELTDEMALRIMRANGVRIEMLNPQGNKNNWDRNVELEDRAVQDLKAKIGKIISTKGEQ
jgi:hypothetical protein